MPAFHKLKHFAHMSHLKFTRKESIKTGYFFDSKVQLSRKIYMLT